jgi:hypothetical protein
MRGQKEFFLKSAKGQTSRERIDAFWRSVGEFFVQFIPFYGCVTDIISGVLEKVLYGVFSCTADALMMALGLSGGVSKIMGLAKSVAPVKFKAFQIMKISTSSLGSAVNPLAGTVDLIKGGASALKNIPKFVQSGVCHVTRKGAMLLLTGVDKLRVFLGGRLFEAVSSPPRPRWLDAPHASLNGQQQGFNTSAVRINGRYFRIDINGQPFGPPQRDFTPLNAPA